MIALKQYVKGDPMAFIVIKPGFDEYSKQIIEMFEEEGWRMVKIRTKKLLLQEAHRLYAVHKKESFYEDLCKYMSSAPSTAILWTREADGRSDNYWLKQVSKLKDTIRERWSESDMRNVMHSSDSVESLKNESQVFF